MKEKLLCLLFLCATFCSSLTYAQSRRIGGKVTSRDDGAPLPGVSVTVLGTTMGTNTDGNGRFILTIPAESRTLRFSFLGYTPQDVSIGAEAIFEVVLEPNASSLDEVVVVAGGLTAQRREIGAASSTISAQSLTQGKSSNVASGLSGKVPGLQVNAVSGGVNPNYRIVLRGNRSITGDNQALIVIDNVIVPSSMLGNINPEDIEDIQVLNGALAAAKYGSDASNGALIVTTKKGKDGQTLIKISNTTTLENVAYFPKTQSQFGSGTTPDDVPVYTPYENQQYGPAYDGSMVTIGKPLQDGSIQTVPYSPTNGKQDFWETGLANQTDFSVTSGTDKSSFYLAGQYYTVNSTVPYDEYDRISIRINGDRKVYDNLSIGYKVNYIQNFYDQTSATSSMFNDLLMTPSHVDITNYEDWQNNPFANPNGFYNEYYDNPYFTAQNNRRETRNEYVQGNIELKWNPYKPLMFTYRIGATSQNYSNKAYTNKFTFSDYTKSISGSAKTDIAGSVSDGSGYEIRIVSDLIAEYRTDFSPNFSFYGMAGTTLRDDRLKDVSVSANGLVIDGLYNVSNTLNNLGGGEGTARARQIGVYGEARIGYKNLLYLDITARNDWRSVLDRANWSFFYPAASLSFIASDAIPALKEAAWLQSLKIRGGYSEVGKVNLSQSNFGAYALNPTYGQAAGYPYSSGAGFSLGGTLVAQDIKPELTKGFEAGFDFETFRSRLNGGFTYYKTNTVDQTITVSVSSGSGFTGLRTNVGEVQNKGIESYLNITPIRSSTGWEWSLGANYTYNKNEVISLSNQSDVLVLSTSGGSRVLAQVGSPFPLLQTTQYNRDPEGRIIVDPITGYPASDGTFYDVGVTNPPHILGLNTELRYKNFRLYTLFEYRSGNYIYNGVTTGYDFSGAGIRTTWYNRDRFVIPNSSYLVDGEYVENTNIAVRSGGADFWTDGTRNTGIGENYVNSAAFWKFREASLSYIVPASVFGGSKYIKGATVSLQGRNLFLWLPKTNLYTDPEYSANGASSNAIGITNLSQTPPARYFGGTVTLTF